MANSGYLGGDISMAKKQAMIAKYLHPLASFAVDRGVQNQCRCGGTKYIRWRGRYYCPTCGRWIRRLVK